MDPINLLAKLRQQGFVLLADGDRLVVRHPQKKLEPYDRQQIIHHKPVILKFLQVEKIRNISNKRPQEKRLEYAGLCGRLSRGRRLESVMIEAFEKLCMN